MVQRNAVLVILAAGYLGWGAGYRLDATTQKPVVEKHIDQPNRNTMQTVEQLWTAAAIVVEAQVVSSRTTESSIGTGPYKQILTFHELRTAEVFKTDGSIKGPNTALTMRQSGGDIDRGDRVERYISSGQPLLSVGKTYVLFLKRYDVSGSVIYSTGALSADGIFEVRGAAAHTPSKRSVAVDFAARGTSELVRRLRELRGTKGNCSPQLRRHC